MRVLNGQFLRFDVYSSVSGAVQITGRIQIPPTPEYPEGEIVPLDQTIIITVVTPDTANTGYKPLVEGEILDISSYIQTVVQTGQAFIVCYLVNSDNPTNQFIYRTLFSGYLQSRQRVGYPFTGIQTPDAIRGAFLQTVDSNPAAGANATILRLQGAIRRIVSLKFQLTTDANVANRRIVLRIGRSFSNEYMIVTQFDHAASLTKQYSFSVNNPLEYERAYNTTPNNVVHAPLPMDLLIMGSIAQHDIDVVVLNIQAGDQLSQITYQYYQRILES